jgi:uncharacterized protein
VKRRVLRATLWLVLLAGLGLNVAAFVHARALTHFSAGPRTPPPHRLTTFQKLAVLARGARLGRARNSRTPADVGLPFERHVFAGRGGLPLEAWFVPNAPPAPARGLVALFHGHAGCKADLLHEARHFHGLGFSVLLVDFPGSGGSGGERTSIGFHEAEDVGHAAAYARALPGGGTLVLHGASMGAAAVLKAVADRTVDPAALILEAPFDRLRNTVAHRFEEMGLPAFPVADLLVFWGGVQQGFPALAHDPRAYAARVSAPALLVYGDRDAYVRPAEARSVAEALRGPRSILTCEGVGHASCLRARPGPWKEAVGNFLDRYVPET